MLHDQQSSQFSLPFCGAGAILERTTTSEGSMQGVLSDIYSSPPTRDPFR